LARFGVPCGHTKNMKNIEKNYNRKKLTINKEKVELGFERV
jgi:hypothetical protein